MIVNYDALGFLKENFEVNKNDRLKKYVYEIRKASVKGQKDKIDIFGLLRLPLDWAFYQKILKEVGQEKLAVNLKTILKNTLRVQELDLKNHQMAKLRKEVLAKIA